MWFATYSRSGNYYENGIVVGDDHEDCVARGALAADGNQVLFGDPVQRAQLTRRE